MMLLDLSKNDCMGCQQCADVCPKKAIEYINDAGFIYPKINENICISCGLCEKKCPAINASSTKTTRPKVYAAWIKDDAQRLKATSGGICYELSKYIIKQRGKVAGVVWSEDYKDAHYEIIQDYEGLEKISQSKYFQPATDSIYAKVKRYLDEDDTVLFIGAACYGEALRLYLGRDYPNLIICDFICRGYTSQIFHQKRIEFLEKKMGADISYVQYKNKKEGWNNFGTLFCFKNGKEYFVGRDEDPYEIMFTVDDYNTRPSCFDCKYRTAIRKSDITVGDFWGIRNVSPEEMKKGISTVLINSEKGQKLFERIREEIVFEKRDIVEVEAGNPALRKSFPQKEGAEVFFEDMENHTMEYIYEKYGSKGRSNKLNIMLGKIKELSRCNIIQFVKYNYLCASVVREKGRYIIPFRGTNIRIDKSSRLYLKGNLYLNTLKHGRTREEMYFTLNRGAEIRINGKTTIATGSTIDVMNDSKLVIGSCDTNIGAVIICANHIEMGNDVQIGRGVVIYDSNHHQTGMNNQKKLKPLLIEDHVWLCTGATITKGLKVGSGAICGMNSTVMSNVKEHTMVMGNPAKIVMTEVEW